MNLLTTPARITAPAVNTPSAPSGKGALASLALTLLLSSLGTSIANVGLPALGRAFDASFAAIQWVVLAYLLTLTALIVGVGRLGDVVGRRRLLLLGILVFTAASGLCGAASSLPVLIAGRALQGLAAASMMALSLALVSAAVPPSRTGTAMGLLGTMSAVGTALGPTLGGLLLATLGWRAIFFVLMPLGVVALGLAFRTLPRDRPEPTPTGAGLDLWGTLLLAATLMSYALAVTMGRGRYGPFHPGLLLAALVGVGLFVRVEKRSTAPLIRLAVFRDHPLSVSLVQNVLVSTVLMATLVVGPFHLSRSLGLEPMLVGLGLSVGPVVAALVGVPAGRAVDRLGAARMTGAGLAGIAVGTVMLALIPAAAGLPGYLGALVVITAGYALFQAANNTAVMSRVIAADRGVMSGLLALSRNLGLITGASVLGAVFAFAAGTNDLASAAPAAIATGTRVTFAVAGLLTVGALALTCTRRPTHPRGATSALTPVQRSSLPPEASPGAAG